MMRSPGRFAAAGVVAPIVVFLAAVAVSRGTAAPGPPQLLKLQGDIGVHDPHIVKAGNMYYIFSTRGEIRSSKDLRTWTLSGRLFDKLPEWVSQEIPVAKEVRAPDVAFFNGKYHCYYTVTLDFEQNSLIGLLTNQTLDPKSPNYKWVDEGLVVRSSYKLDWNAADADPVVEDANNVWLVWGSFWSGIKMRRIDPKTGKFSTIDTAMYALAKGPRTTIHEIGGAIEGAYLVHHEGYWYLFASLDDCCLGNRSTYNVVVGRSRNITGPFVDKSGMAMPDGGGTQVIGATTPTWRGPGHNSILQEAGGDYFVFHAYPWKGPESQLYIGVNARTAAINSGTYATRQHSGSQLFISTMVWEDGWPLVAELP
jgi:arabinan endo-1,5-alpha-L-arabinosidase